VGQQVERQDQLSVVYPMGLIEGVAADVYSKPYGCHCSATTAAISGTTREMFDAFTGERPCIVRMLDACGHLASPVVEDGRLLIGVCTLKAFGCELL
jgi:hypothetical protein